MWLLRIVDTGPNKTKLTGTCRRPPKDGRADTCPVERDVRWLHQVKLRSVPAKATNIGGVAVLVEMLWGTADGGTAASISKIGRGACTH
jgi:hypothetical protein